MMVTILQETVATTVLLKLVSLVFKIPTDALRPAGAETDS